jgi:hypothetical protein
MSKNIIKISLDCPFNLKFRYYLCACVFPLKSFKLKTIELSLHIRILRVYTYRFFGAMGITIIYSCLERDPFSQDLLKLMSYLAGVHAHPRRPHRHVIGSHQHRRHREGCHHHAATVDWSKNVFKGTVSPV